MFFNQTIEGLGKTQSVEASKLRPSTVVLDQEYAATQGKIPDCQLQQSFIGEEKNIYSADPGAKLSLPEKFEALRLQRSS